MDGLASEAGVTVEQIERWRKAKAVSPALRRGPDPFVWTEAHLREVIAIRDILDNRMTLADIRDLLHQPKDEEIADDFDEEDWSIDAL